MLNNSKPTSKTRALHFRKIWGLIMLLGIINYSCEKEDFDLYYVKYKIDSSTVNSGGEINVRINSKNNEDIDLTINQNTKWEVIIGPVSKGFNAEISVSNATGTGSLKMYTEIHVSKNDSPFVIQAINGHWSNDASVNYTGSKYTIDY